MTLLRQAKIKAIEEDIETLEWQEDEGAEVILLGWGSTYGAIGAARRRLRQRGIKTARAHLKHLNPFPKNTEDVLRRFDKVIVPEVNMGQLSKLIRQDFLIDAISINQVRGLPFRAGFLEEEILKIIS
jgi:2-oxoglutarate ferredoxin oxidoreductase subunit alpha